MRFRFFYSVFYKENDYKRYLFVTFNELSEQYMYPKFLRYRDDYGTWHKIPTYKTIGEIELDSIEEAEELKAALAFALLFFNENSYLQNVRGFAKYSGYNGWAGTKTLPETRTIKGGWNRRELKKLALDCVNYIQLIDTSKTDMSLHIKTVYKRYLKKMYGIDINNTENNSKDKNTDVLQTTNFVIKSASDIKAISKNSKIQKEKTLFYIMSDIEKAASEGKFEISVNIKLDEQQISQFVNAGYLISQNMNDTIIKW